MLDILLDMLLDMLDILLDMLDIFGKRIFIKVALPYSYGPCLVS